MTTTKPDTRRTVWVDPGVVALLEAMAYERSMSMGELVKQMAIQETDQPRIRARDKESEIRNIIRNLKKP